MSGSRGRTLSGSTSVSDGWAAEALAAPKEAARTKILAAATDLVMARGASELAMTALARRAGVSRSTLYSYFPNAESVLEALVEAETRSFLEDLERRLAGIPDVFDQLGQTIAALIAWVGEKRSGQPAQQRERHTARPPDVMNIHRPLAGLQRRLADVIAASAQAGVLPPDTEPAVAAGFVVTLVFGCRDRLGGTENRHTNSALQRFVLAGLGATRAPVPPPAQP
jgi:AcrR family transcriptional regulator